MIVEILYNHNFWMWRKKGKNSFNFQTNVYKLCSRGFEKIELWLILGHLFSSQYKEWEGFFFSSPISRKHQRIYMKRLCLQCPYQEIENTNDIIILVLLLCMIFQFFPYFHKLCYSCLIYLHMLLSIYNYLVYFNFEIDELVYDVKISQAWKICLVVSNSMYDHCFRLGTIYI